MNQIEPAVSSGTTSAERDQRQLDVQREQDGGDHDHRQRLDRELRETVLQQLLQVLDVARHAGHDHAGLLLGVEVEAEALQVGEDLDAQVVHHPRGEPAGDAREAALGEPR